MMGGKSMPDAHRVIRRPRYEPTGLRRYKQHLGSDFGHWTLCGRPQILMKHKAPKVHSNLRIDECEACKIAYAKARVLGRAA